jgi:hypothetical protein
VAEALERVAAKCALQDVAAIGTVKKSAPLLEFADAFRRLLRMELRHTPVVQEFSATHGVAEMGAPVVGFVDVAHRRGDAAFSHDRVGLAKQRFANQADARAVSQRFDCSAQTRATRADDQNVVFVGFVGGGHRSRRSLKRPEARLRM